MRIGILPALKPQDGGVYQYGLTMMSVLHEGVPGIEEDDFVVFAHDTADPALAFLTRASWQVFTFCPPGEPGPNVPPVNLGNLDDLQRQPIMDRWFKECGIELMLYPNPHRLSFETTIPYVMAIHDLQHRLQPHFPEVSADGERERREYLFRPGSRLAQMLIADSPVGREDILSCYGAHGVTRERVEVLPFLPAVRGADPPTAAQCAELLQKHGLPGEYLFYPAQFWPHKNHVRLVEALARIRQQYDRRIPLVLTGSHEGRLREKTFDRVINAARRGGIEDHLHVLGYVPEEELTTLYAGATALVMPTFFGPTNIPILEAWALDCPVITSDIRGIDQQVGSAAILVEPESVESIANGIYRAWVDPNLRETLVEKGQQRLANYTREDYRRRLGRIMVAAKQRVWEKRPLVADARTRS